MGGRIPQVFHKIPHPNCMCQQEAEKKKSIPRFPFFEQPTAIEELIEEHKWQAALCFYRLVAPTQS